MFGFIEVMDTFQAKKHVVATLKDHASALLPNSPFKDACIAALEDVEAEGKSFLCVEFKHLKKVLEVVSVCTKVVTTFSDSLVNRPSCHKSL
mgnify:CR=1 FL=1